MKFRDDHMAIGGVFIVFFLCAVWTMILRAQGNQLTEKTFRVQVLIVRTGLFLPAYAWILFITLLTPNSFAGLEVLISAAEAYSLYCFFAMIIANMGGPLAAVEYVKKQAKEPLCVCCPSDPATFYRACVSAMWQVLVVRVLVVFIGAMATYGGQDTVQMVTQFVAIAFLVRAVMSCVFFYESLMSIGLNHFWKLIMVKISVVMLVGEALIEEFMRSGGVFDGVKPANGWSGGDIITRWYALIILMEYVVYSVFFYIHYSKPIDYVDFPTQEVARGVAVSNTDLSMKNFFYEVMQLQDFFTGTQDKRLDLPDDATLTISLVDNPL